MSMPTELGRVLVVEDEPDVASVLEFALRRAGATDVIVAGDGDTALLLARALQPDLILCDLMIPGIDGLEVATRLREAPAVAAPLIFVTAAAGTAFRVRTPEDYGAIGVLPKPFDVSKLGAQVKEMLEKAQG
jgi:DNA-binding response OmpR family regulator